MTTSNDTKITIRHIPKTMTDAELCRLFSKVGNIKSYKIMRNELSGESAGYGVIDFDTNWSAQSAVKKFNGFRIGYKMLQVNFTKLVDNSKTANLLIKNLPFWINDVILMREFSRFGYVLRCKVFKNTLTCYGYVLYQDVNTAEKAKVEMEGQKWPNDPSSNILYIKFAQPPIEKPNMNNVNSINKNTYVLPQQQQQFYYINNLPHIIPYTYAPWTSMNPMLQTQPYVSPNLIYKSNYSYAQYYPYMNNLQNYPIVYDNTVPKSKLDPDSIVVYVYNTGNMMNERTLYNLFKRFGSIVSVFVPRAYQSNFSKNFAFIAFSDIKCAQKAIDEMNGFILENRQLQVSFKKPKSQVNLKKAENSSHNKEPVIEQNNVESTDIKASPEVPSPSSTKEIETNFKVEDPKTSCDKPVNSVPKSTIAEKCDEISSVQSKSQVTCEG